MVHGGVGVFMCEDTLALATETTGFPARGTAPDISPTRWVCLRRTAGPGWIFQSVLVMNTLCGSD